MAYFMHFYKKISLNRFFNALLLACLLASSQFSFADSSIVIKNASLQPEDSHYSLNADVDISFDKDIEEAINKGVPLTFLVEFQIVSPRQYWFDDEVVTTTQAIMLSYHALTRQYLVNHKSHQLSFETLPEAKLAMMQLRDWKVVDKSLLEKGEVYRAALLVRLDQTKLPKAIQVDTISSEKWNVSSEKFEWIQF